MKYELTDETRTSTRWIGAITGPRWTRYGRCTTVARAAGVRGVRNVSSSGPAAPSKRSGRTMSELLTDEALEYVVTGVLKLPDQEALTPPRAALLGVTLLAAYWSRHEAGDK